MSQKIRHSALIGFFDPIHKSKVVMIAGGDENYTKGVVYRDDEGRECYSRKRWGVNFICNSNAKS